MSNSNFVVPLDVSEVGNLFANQPLSEGTARTLFGVGATFGPPVRVNSAAFEAARVLKATPGSLLTLFGFNNGAAGFVQLFDSATVPADGVAPVAVWPVPAGASFSLGSDLVGVPFADGIAAVFSSTAAVKTLAGPSLYLTAVVR